MKLHFLSFLFAPSKKYIFTLFRLALIALIFLFLVSCTRAQTQTESESIKLSLVAEGLSQPIDISHIDDNRLFIAEKTGAIQVIEDGKLRTTKVLDLSNKVSTNSERGLLGLAFDPNFETTNYFFVNYTNKQGTTTISRFKLNNETTVADIQSEKILLEISQPFPNHNGGQIAFGPDGYLYIATGDGGAGGDPLNAGQDLNSLLGKILRIDVSQENPENEASEALAYRIPEDNPFLNQENVRPEIWAYGLRNPWRMSFDKLRGDLYIADVGQNAFEEVNFQAADSKGGENYGWRLMEAKNCFQPKEDCNPDKKLVQPILNYAHSAKDGRSITGGYVYRGIALNSLHGNYIYGDFVSGRIWQAQADPNGIKGWRTEVLKDTKLSISTFGMDFQSELYVASFSGGIYKFVKE